MCDGLTRNLPKELDTIVASCLAHGRRNFVDIYDRFSDECRYVIEAFKVIYHNDKVAREEGMSDEERLLHHQTHSQQTMDDLKAWVQRQLDEKLVERNSALGEAINYLLKRWDSLTLFLRKAGAPLDNNICERALHFGDRPLLLIGNQVPVALDHTFRLMSYPSIDDTLVNTCCCTV